MNSLTMNMNPLDMDIANLQKIIQRFLINMQNLQKFTAKNAINTGHGYSSEKFCR